ncbi:MAG: hypothetical protein KKB81_05905 [Candidatus Margulisbacteria bacterium]|nr:hypothetical protein [Candidatus Margulisiibacteriota bacterium]MBU1021821.1 hypothetical protein [Candidatus Margulisiibacteriota bacterium]MBU1728980.1 hypothetical protein [Candidatus Margulisiibacteriota bacterium]MBU1954467.1 hypothetical protein [Candidatus Margulisiibacteriota bacterium]
MAVNKIELLKQVNKFLAKAEAGHKPNQGNTMKVTKHGRHICPPPKIEDIKHTMAEAVEKAIKEEPIWKASVDAGKVTAEQIKAIVIEALA